MKDDVKSQPEKTTTLMERIDHDEILSELTHTLIHFTRRAQDKREALQKREHEIIAKIEKKEHVPTPATTWNVDEIEKSVESIESEDILWRKVLALRNAKSVPWTNEPEYREAMRQYLIYITPILADLEEAKQETEARMQVLYDELDRIKKERKVYDDKVNELFIKAGLISDYIGMVSYYAQFGSKIRSDYIANSLKDRFKKIPIDIKNEPVITYGHEPIEYIICR